LESLNGVILCLAVQALVVDALHGKNHAQVPTLGEKGGLVPEAVKVDVRVERLGLLPGLDDFVDAQHAQQTSTRGIACFAASYRGLYRSDLARIRRNAGSAFVTQCPKTKPPKNTAKPAR